LTRWPRGEFSLARIDSPISDLYVSTISKNFNSNKIVRRSKLTRGKGKSANKTLVTKEQVHSMLVALKEEVQTKYLSTSVYNLTTPSVNGTLVQPVLPAQGTTNGQREGDSIAINAIQCRLFIYNPGCSL
jgi:hypothetical protein